jgi:hypothetical protein
MKSKKLRAKTVQVKNLAEQQVVSLYSVYEKYYENTSFSVFQKDLNNKNSVILLLESSTDRICGFSTILDLELEENGKRILGLYSGDTVVEKEYWGQGTLGIAFLRYLFLKKLCNPLTPCYWFLISKGYKTYLLMANNFKEHYPRFEKETPPEKNWILNQFATRLFPKYYNSQCGVIRFDETGVHLKAGVADISQDLAVTNPRIAFFLEKNPSWMQGEELACIAKMSFLLPFAYSAKVAFKQVSKPFFQMLPKRKLGEMALASPFKQLQNRLKRQLLESSDVRKKV